MKILITGAAGQVGRELVELATARKLDVAAFDSRSLDITDAHAVRTTIARERPDRVINAAAYTAVDRAEIETERAYAVNHNGVANLATACRGIGAPLLHISTDYVFDGNKSGEYVETDTPNPTSVYGASKLAGEQALASLWEQHITLRVSWIFGQHGNNFVKTMLRLGRERDELKVVNDQFGAPTGARCIAQALLDIATHPQLGADEFGWGVRHLRSEPGVTWYQFACEIFERAAQLGIIARKPQVHPITSAEFPPPVKRPVNSKLGSRLFWPASVHGTCDWSAELDIVLDSLR
jgi:dTDP-4-dehydrorhamnose reductase